MMFVWPHMLITFVKFFRENEVFLCLGVGDGVVYSSTNQSN